MNEEHLRAQQPEPVEICNRTATRRRDVNAALAVVVCKWAGAVADKQSFFLRFRNVRREPQAVPLRIVIDGAEELWGYGVRRVRRHARTQGLVFVAAIFVDLFAKTGHRFFGLALCGTENFLVCDAPQAKFTQSLPRNTKIHDFRHARDSRAEHLDRAKTRRLEHLIARELFVFRPGETRNP